MLYRQLLRNNDFSRVLKLDVNMAVEKMLTVAIFGLGLIAVINGDLHLFRDMEDTSYESYHPNSEHRYYLWNTRAPSHLLFDWSRTAWKPKEPLVKWKRGLHYHSYYTVDYIQRIHGFLEKNRKEAYYKSYDEPWIEHPAIQMFTQGILEGPDDGPLPTRTPAEETTTHIANHAGESHEEYPPWLRHIMRNPFRKRK